MKFESTTAALTPNEVQALYNWAPGPVGYWKLDESSDGTSATTRYDSSGNGNNLTDENTTSSTTGKYGKAANFVSSDSEETLTITDGNQSGLDITGPLTISAWVKPSSLNLINTIVDKGIREDDTQNSYRLYLHSTRTVRFSVSSDGINWTGVISTTGINLGEWSHISAEYDGTKIKIYINGILDTAEDFSSSIFDGTAGFFIGAGEWTDGRRIYPFDGSIDDVRIYNYARTSSRI